MNQLTGLFQELVADANEATQALRYRNSFLNSIYWGAKPIAASPYTAVMINIPEVYEADVVDIGAGPIQPADTKHRTVKVELDKNFSTSYVISEFDAGRSARNLRREYVQARIEAVARSINRTIASLVNATNFPNYSIIAGAGADKFERKDITAAWTKLAAAGVPVSAKDQTYLTVSPEAYGEMLGDSSFINESIVAVNAAESAQQQARLKMLYGAEVNYDQHLEKYESGKLPGVFYHKFAIAGTGMTPPAEVAGPVVETAVVPLVTNGPSVRLQIFYSGKDQGWVVHVNTWWGVAVARPEMAVLLQTA